jgi:uncharacterized lipoprotein NlpE involved in copper resistance
MKNLLRITLALLVTLTWVGCDSNDDDDDNIGDDPTAIHGTWVSEGDDIAQGLVDVLGATRIEATFNADGTYVVETVSTLFPTFPTLTGTYETDETEFGDIREIALQQQTPQALVSEGIYEIDGDVMTYEVINVAQGTPPTAEAGFGSTVAGDDPAGYWTQTFVQVEE